MSSVAEAEACYQSDEGLVESGLLEGRLAAERALAHLAARAFDLAGGQLQEIPSSQRSWDTQRLEYLATLGPRVTRMLSEGHWGIVAAALKPDQTRLVTARVLAASLNGQGLWFDTETGARGELMKAEEPLFCLAVDTGGKNVLLGSAAGKVYRCGSDGSRGPQRQLGGGAALAAAWDEVGAAWLIGLADGSVHRLQAETLQTVQELRVSGAVWALAIAGTSDRQFLAVAGDGPDVALFRSAGPAQPWEPHAKLKLLPSAEGVRAVHAVQFSPDAGDLYALDSTFGLTAWGLKDQEAKWSLLCGARDYRQAELARVLGQLRPPCKIPLPLRRNGCAILNAGHPGQLVTASEDGLIRTWQMPAQERDGIKRLTVRVGKQPRIVFARSRPEVLWALDRDGSLWAVDTQADRLLDRSQAHEGGEASVAFLPKADALATVGGDHLVEFCHVAGGKIRPADHPPTDHDAPLMSIAVSPDERWVAAVDGESRLSVWQYADGERVFLTQLGSEGQGKPAGGGWYGGRRR